MEKGRTNRKGKTSIDMSVRKIKQAKLERGEDHAVHSNQTMQNCRCTQEYFSDLISEAPSRHMLACMLQNLLLLRMSEPDDKQSKHAHNCHTTLCMPIHAADPCLPALSENLMVLECSAVSSVFP
jgi:hypothetical protein